MKVNVNENESMEKILQSIDKKGAEKDEERRQRAIKIEREEAARKTRRTRKVITRSERIKMQQEELQKIRRERKAKERKELIYGICFFVSLGLIGYILDPVGFVEFFKTVGSIIVLIITGVVVKFVSSMPHYTTPHRYIVQDEINKNYKIEKGWRTTTFVPKNKR